MNMHAHRIRREGFTLVELLAVIAIVGVLAAIVIATIGGVRQRAQNATCMSNLRQIGAAALLYASDHHGMLPPAQISSEAWPMRTWMYQIQSYAEGRKLADTTGNIGLCYDGIFHCPAKDDWALSGTGVTDLQRTSYGMNTFAALGLSAAGLADYPSVRMAVFIRPSATMLASDYNASDYKIPNQDYLYKSSSSLLSLRHSGRHNVVMVDGHVESLSAQGLNYYLVKANDSAIRPF
ncbi:MAG: DUF1559 domain-containing protein [Opitutaceae bacterium]|jgi:prepilin-type N-terminal cleavage/methylation domain-containing protein/prepilin-type processing-associated H-X9-DG protein